MKLRPELPEAAEGELESKRSRQGAVNAQWQLGTAQKQKDRRRNVMTWVSMEIW